MPYKRKYARKSKRKPYSTYRRRYPGPVRSAIRINQMTHYFKTKLATAWTFAVTANALTANSSVAFFGTNIKLSNMSNHTDFQTLFDMYRINGIKLTFLNGYNTGKVTELKNSKGVEFGVPTLHIVFDPDDSVSPSSADQVLERPQSRSIYMDRKRTFYFKPVLERNANDGVNNFNIMQRKNRPYVDIAQPDAAYNGLKMALIVPYNNASDVNITMNYVLDIVVTYYVEYRNPR